MSKYEEEAGGEQNSLISTLASINLKALTTMAMLDYPWNQRKKQDRVEGGEDNIDFIAFPD